MLSSVTSILNVKLLEFDGRLPPFLFKQSFGHVGKTIILKGKIIK